MTKLEKKDLKRLTNINNIRVLKGRLEEAIYKEQEINEYKNNPFIEALPRIFTDDDIIDKFYNIPEFEENYKYQSKNVRFHTLKRIKNYSQVFNLHLILESKLSTMIRRGYLARNPKEADYLKKLGVLNNIKNNNLSANELSAIEEIDYRMKFMRSTADSLTLLGISGIGKTTAIERLLLMYPQVIKHNTYKKEHFTKTQIVWLKIDCPYDGSLATLCKSFFKSIDNILGTKYFEKFGYTSRITSTMMISMTQLASMYGIGILVIDEIQHLINSKNDPEEMLNFFVTLSNTIGIPTILIGTPRAQELFKGNFRQARRASSDGFILWDRMDKESKEWDILINILWEMQCLQEYTELTELMKNAFYDETQGITSVVINLFILAQEKALAEEKEKITVELIRETAKEYLKLLHPMLKAIRTNNMKEIAKYDDISIDFDHVSDSIFNKLELTNRMYQMYEERKNDIEHKRKNRIESLAFDLKSLRIFINLSDSDLVSLVSKEVEKHPVDISYDEIKGICIEKAVYKNNQEKAKDERKIKSSKSNDDGLFKLLKFHKKSVDTKQHIYEVLLKNDYIKHIVEFY